MPVQGGVGRGRGAGRRRGGAIPRSQEHRRLCDDCVNSTSCSVHHGHDECSGDACPAHAPRCAAMEAEPILNIPLGEVVTLTWEGAENGFVTVDYGGVRGWAYADLLG